MEVNAKFERQAGRGVKEDGGVGELAVGDDEGRGWYWAVDDSWEF